MLSKYPPVTSLSSALSTPTIDFKAEEIPVLPQTTTLYGRNWFQLPQKHTCSRWKLLVFCQASSQLQQWVLILLVIAKLSKAGDLSPLCLKVTKTQPTNQPTTHTPNTTVPAWWAVPLCCKIHITSQRLMLYQGKSGKVTATSSLTPWWVTNQDTGLRASWLIYRWGGQSSSQRLLFY